MGWSQLAFEEIYQREAGRCVATMIRLLGDVELAEDAVADAFAVAAVRWKEEGIPPNPGGWVTTTARRRAIDHLRRESRRAELEQSSERERDGDLGSAAVTDEVMADEVLADEVIADDQLRLIFLCCHPDVEADAQVALTLKLLGGLNTPEVANAFLVPEATMAQRLIRAKKKIRKAQLAYRVPSTEELPDRLVPVLATLSLIFSEGSTEQIANEGLRLTRLVAELLPGRFEPKGLLALMLLTEARRPARLDAGGRFVRLPDQDRTLWRRDLIEEGQGLVRACLAHNQPGPYQLQAAIAAVHGDAPAAEATDWSQIVALYDQLFVLQPTSVVALNRGIAVSEAFGPEAGLEALSGLDLEEYRFFHAARGEMLARLGRSKEAVVAFERAGALATDDVEVAHFLARRTDLSQQAES